MKTMRQLKTQIGKYENMKSLGLKRLEAITVEAERQEVFAVVKQRAKLKVEKPQSNFKGGRIRMWTVLTPYYDRKGFNRQFSTFSLEGLKEIGLVIANGEGA